MNCQVVIRPEAENDLGEAYDWYEDKVEGLRTSFLASIEAALDFIKQGPLKYQTVHKGIRRALVRRFPYDIFYLIENETIIVIAVFHAKRNPKSWRLRK